MYQAEIKLIFSQKVIFRLTNSQVVVFSAPLAKGG